MTPEEIQQLSDEELVNKLMSIGHDFLSITEVIAASRLFFLMKDLKREVLFRMYHGSKGQPTKDSDV